MPARLPPLVCRFAIFVAGKIGRSDVPTTLERTTIDMYSYAGGPSESKIGRRSKTEAPCAFAPARCSGKHPAYRQLFGPFLFTGVHSTWHHLAAIQRPTHPARRRSGGLPTLDIAEKMIEQAPGITRCAGSIGKKRSSCAGERPSDNRRQVLCFITKAWASIKFFARTRRPS